MIDIHSHILFGIDDGCKTLEDSIGLIKKAIEVGVTDLYLTPHYAPRRKFDKSVSIVKDNFNILKSKVAELKLPINLYLGHEIDELDNFKMLIEDSSILSLNESKYVLIDFGNHETNIDEYIYNVIIAGYKPIIAHVERYDYISDYSLFDTWKNTGALFQVNASSFFHANSKEEKKKAKYLLKHNLIDFVASDTHRNPYTLDDLKKACQCIQRKGIKINSFLL